MKIGVLTHDNGDYDVYVAFFSDPDKLAAAVKKLNAERIDRNTGDPADAEYHVITVEDVPDVIDDAFLDKLAGLLEDGGADIEWAKDRQERLDEAADEAEVEFLKPIKPVPGQEEAGL